MPPHRMVRALSHRNFSLFLFGQSISLIGTWMQQVAMTWLVYRLTGSPFLLGLVGFSSQFPAFFVAPLAGVLADRCNRHRALLLTQTLAMVQAVLLVALTASHHQEIWQLIALGLFLGLVNAFDMPLRQAFLSDMVTNREDLGNAIALNSSIVNGARLVGPSVAGLLIAVGGELSCFLVNAVSYVAVLGALLAMRDLPPSRPNAGGRVLHRLQEGFVYAFRFPPIRAILSLVALISLMSMTLSVLMPVIATRELHGDSRTLGFLMASSGAGALGGALYLASRRSVLGLGIRIALAAGLYGVGLIVLSWSDNLMLSMIILFVTGFSMMLEMAASNTLLQTIVEEDKRGRVMSFYTMAFLGMAPLGSLLAGTFADRLGAANTIRLAGIVCIFGGGLFALNLPKLRQHVRPIYQRAGILPQPDSLEPQQDGPAAVPGIPTEH